MNRRSFLRGLIAAPAIVTFGNLMPVRGLIMPWKSTLEVVTDGLFEAGEIDLRPGAINRVKTNLIYWKVLTPREMVAMYGYNLSSE